MRASNKMVREWLLEEMFDHIWFKSHNRRNDYVFTQKGSYMAQDIWNLFDGIAINRDGYVYFLQMKTNAWAESKPLEKFVADTKHVGVLSFNVTNKLKKTDGKYVVKWREY